MKDRHSRAQFDFNFDSAGLSAGKFCESVLRFLQQTLTGTHVAFGKHIPNFPDECRTLVSLPQTAGPESLRIIIPRALVFLYTLRGKRGIGHVGGDVEANGIDAAAIVRVSDWIVCELIRIYHSLSLEEAQGIVDSISTRSIPVIWEVGGKKRTLRTDLDFKQQVLVLAYSDLQGGVLSEDLFDWTEYSSLSMFRKAVLRLSKNRFSILKGPAPASRRELLRLVCDTAALRRIPPIPLSGRCRSGRFWIHGSEK